MVIFLGDLAKLWLKGQETFMKTTYLFEKKEKRFQQWIAYIYLFIFFVSKFMFHMQTSWRK